MIRHYFQGQAGGNLNVRVRLAIILLLCLLPAQHTIAQSSEQAAPKPEVPKTPESKPQTKVADGKVKAWRYVLKSGQKNEDGDLKPYHEFGEVFAEVGTNRSICRLWWTTSPAISGFERKATPVGKSTDKYPLLLYATAFSDRDVWVADFKRSNNNGPCWQAESVTTFKRPEPAGGTSVSHFFPVVPYYTAPLQRLVRLPGQKDWSCDWTREWGLDWGHDALVNSWTKSTFSKRATDSIAIRSQFNGIELTKEDLHEVYSVEIPESHELHKRSAMYSWKYLVSVDSESAAIRKCLFHRRFNYSESPYYTPKRYLASREDKMREVDTDIFSVDTYSGPDTKKIEGRLGKISSGPWPEDDRLNKSSVPR